MDSKKKRISILKKFSEEDTTVEINTKLKRRISFSGKKSVRVYSGEEEAKAWNNSYEESDNAENASAVSERQSAPATKNPNINGEPTMENQVLNLFEEDTKNIKENICTKKNSTVIDTSISEQNTPFTYVPRKSFCQKNTFRSSFTPFHTTRDFINNTYHADTLHIENSVDISLCDRESHDRESQPSMSFSLSEFERDNKPFAKICKDCQCSDGQSLVISMDHELKKSSLDLAINEDLQSLNQPMDSKRKTNKSIISNNMKETDSKNEKRMASLNVTAFNMEQTLRSTDNISKFGFLNRNENNIYACSTIGQKGDKENIPPGNADFTLENAIDSKKMVSPISKGYDFQEHAKVTKACLQFNERSHLFPLQSESDNSANSERGVRIFSQPIVRRELQEDKREVSLEISIQNQELEQSIPQSLVANKSTNVQQNAEFEDSQSRLNLDLDITKTSKEKQCKTIIFGGKELSESVIADTSQIQDHVAATVNNGNTVLFGLHKAYSKLNDTTGNGNTKDFSKHKEQQPQCLSEADKKGAIPKVVVVRKHCTPNQRQETIKKMELERFQRYHSEEEKVNKHDHESICCRNKKELLCLTSIDTESHLNMSSLLFSPQYGSKSNFNFRQLNDEIEEGKIKPFPITKVLLSEENNQRQKPQDLIGTKETQNVFEKKEAILFETEIRSDLQFPGNKDDDMQLDDTIYLPNKDTGVINDQIQSKLNSPEKREIENLSFKFENMMQNNTTNINSGSSKVAKFRRTIYYNDNNDIDVDSSMMTNKTKVEPINKKSKQQLESRLREESISEIDFCSMTPKNRDKNVSTHMTKNQHCSRRDSDLDSSKSPSKIKFESLQLKSGNGLQENCKVLEECSVSNSKRKTVYYIKDNEIDLHNSIEMDLVVAHDKSNDIKISEERQKRQESEGSRRTLHFIKEDMTLDHSLLPDTVSKYHQSEPLNIAKHSLLGQLSLVSDKIDGTFEESFSLQLNASIARDNKTIVYVDNNDLVDITGSSRKEARRISKFLEGTPHRSVLEFERLEMESRRDSDIGVKHQMLEPDLDTSSPKLKGTKSFKYINRNTMLESNLPSLHNLEIADARKDIQRKIIFDSNEESNSSCSVGTKWSDQRKVTLYDTVAIGIDESGLKSLHIEEVSTREKCNKEESKTICLLTPVLNVNSKRTTLSLTPIQPVAKKRLTNLFNSCVGKSSILKYDGETCKSVNNIKNVTLDQPNVNLIIAEVTQTQSDTFKHYAESAGNSSVRTHYENDKADTLSDRFLQNCASGVGQNVKNISQALTPLSVECCKLQKQQTAGNDVIIKTDFPVQYDIELDCITEDYKRFPVSSYVSHNTESVKKDNSIGSRNLGGKNDLTLNHSLESIAIPRHASKRNEEHPNPSLFDFNQQQIQQQLQCEKQFEYNLCESQMKAKEDPITKSVYHFSQGQNNVNDCNLSQKPQPTALCEDTAVNIANLKKIYVDLTGHSRLSSDDIDKTRLSLVETLLDEDDEEVLYVDIEPEDANDQSKDSISQIQAQKESVSVATLSNVSLMCRKCKRCQETLLNGSASNADVSFDLPKIPSIPNFGMDRLKQLRSKPTISVVNEYWRRKSLEKSYNLDDVKFAIDICPDQEENNYDEVDNLLSELKNRLKRTEIDIATKRRKQTNISPKSFVQRLEIKLRSCLSNWIFDYQMEARNFYLFTHRRIVTCSILLFVRTDNFGRDVEIRGIELQSNQFLKKNWKPFHYVLDFQLRLELPYDLHSMCRGSDEDSVFAMLNEIDRLCLDVEKFGRCFWLLVCKEKATLIREGKSVYVRKIVRKLLDPTEGGDLIQKTLFIIEVTNIRKICFKDITEPSLHLFREDIQDLPIGLDFLAVFLKDPMCYLKMNV